MSMPNLQPMAVAASASWWLQAHTAGALHALEIELDPAHSGIFASDEMGWRGVWSTVCNVAGSPRACRLVGNEVLSPASRALAGLAADTTMQAEPTLIPHASAALATWLARPATAWGVAYVLRWLAFSAETRQSACKEGRAQDCVQWHGMSGPEARREWIAFQRRLDDFDLSEVELAAAVGAARWTSGWIASAISSAAYPGGAIPGAA